MLAPTTAAPIVPKTKLDATPKRIADKAINPTDNIQHRLIPKTCTNLPQMDAERIATINTIAKMSDVLCGLAHRVYLTQNGVPKVYTPGI